MSTVIEPFIQTASASAGNLLEFDFSELQLNTGGPLILKTTPGYEAAQLGDLFSSQSRFDVSREATDVRLNSVRDLQPSLITATYIGREGTSVLGGNINQHAYQMGRGSLALAGSFGRHLPISNTKIAGSIYTLSAGISVVSGLIETLIAKTGSLESQIVRLDDSFEFKDRNTVVSFLRENPLLVDLLFETRQKISHYFGPETRSALEVFTDPDDGDDHRLFALILTTFPSDEALSRLEQLDQEWWIQQPYEAKRLMNVDVEYVDDSV